MLWKFDILFVSNKLMEFSRIQSRPESEQKTKKLQPYRVSMESTSSAFNEIAASQVIKAPFNDS